MTNLSLVFHQEVAPPTKLWNRDYAAERLTLELTRARSQADYRFSILLIRVEGLSAAGHRLGSSSDTNVWRQVTTLLTQDLRDGEVCCRLASDEFLLIIPKRTDAECAALVELLRSGWAPLPGSREAAVQMSIGLASSRASASTIQGLFAAVDEALDADRARKRSAPLAGVSNGAFIPQFVVEHGVEGHG